MELTLRPSGQRGGADHDWLRTRHTFSFADYRDPAHMGFRQLRVINEDWIAPARGFGRHPHRDMEIVTYMISGALEHRDSMDNTSVLRAGEVQRMSAGTGVEHSEINASRDQTAHLLQIWIHPARRGLAPSHAQRAFAVPDKLNRFRTIVSPTGEGGALRVHQDGLIHASVLERGRDLTYALAPGRHAWLQLVDGALDVNGTRLGAGDGASAAGPGDIIIGAAETAEFLTFDLA
ncbi:pirin family protein [bacterium]|nr:pirin family protein [bacterium]MBU1072204.1 pirin family protein [bacterium]MBU1675820.1 pirin family protein [bacterium]